MEPLSRSLPLILLIEDTENDARLLKRALEVIPDVGFVRCRDGDEALDYLYQRGNFQKADQATGRVAPPNLIFLDLGLPGTSGLDVLRQIKQEEHLKTIAVYIWTSGLDDEALEEGIRLGASGCLLKTGDINLLKHELKRLLAWYLETPQ